MIGNLMIREFERLTEGETELMLKAPVLVCILIAGADGTIDRKEIKEAIAQTRKKNVSVLSAYLEEVSRDFEDKLKVLIQSYPYESTQRTPIIIDELHQLNALWSKIDKVFSVQFYQMLRALAKKIAGSSGGIWGLKTVANEEARYIRLLMVNDPSKN